MQRIQCIQLLHNYYVLHCVTLLCIPPNPPLEPRHSAVPKLEALILGAQTYKNLWKINKFGLLGFLGLQEGLKMAPRRPKTAQAGSRTAQDGPKEAHEAPKTAQEGPNRTPKSASRGQNC